MSSAAPRRVSSVLLPWLPTSAAQLGQQHVGAEADGTAFNVAFNVYIKASSMTYVLLAARASNAQYVQSPKMAAGCKEKVPACSCGTAGGAW